VGPRAGLDTEDRGKIRSSPPGIEPRSPGRPAPSQTLLTELPGSQEYETGIVIIRPRRSVHGVEKKSGLFVS
jgi:hypothetical protein